jgi:ABC-type transport system involved in multi-copper enzyme maturation permease subunit
VSESVARTGAVHDTGYKRYAGARRPASARYRVIVRNQIAMAWRGWWRMKLWVIAAVAVTAVFAILIYAFLFMTRNEVVSGFLGGGRELRMSEFLLPLSVDLLTMIGFILGLSVVAGIVADDLGAGAFEFYFARPVRPEDYVRGKLLAAFVVIGAVTLAGPFVVALVRVSLAGDGGDVLASLHFLPRAFVAGGVATLLYAAVPLALGATGARRRYAIGAWAVFYVVVGNAALGIAHVADVPAVGALSIKGCVMSITYAVFDVQMTRHGGDILPPLGAAIAGAAGWAAAAIAFVTWRVRRAQHRGMGGG